MSSVAFTLPILGLFLLQAPERAREPRQPAQTFDLAQTVPDAEPFVFAIVRSGNVEIFLNAPGPALEEYPAFKGRPIGGTLTLFMEVSNIRPSYDELKDRVLVVMPLETKWYGVTEFAFLDPDGYIITFAQPGT